MDTSQSTRSPAEDQAVHLFRDAGYHVITVPRKSRRDGEFAALVFGDHRGTDNALRLITTPGSHVDVQRITDTPTGERVYLRWHTPPTATADDAGSR